MKELNIRLDFSQSNESITDQLFAHGVSFSQSFIAKIEVNLRANRGNLALEAKINKVICDHLTVLNSDVIFRVVTYF